MKAILTHRSDFPSRAGSGAALLIICSLTVPFPLSGQNVFPGNGNAYLAGSNQLQVDVGSTPGFFGNFGVSGGSVFGISKGSVILQQFDVTTNSSSFPNGNLGIGTITPAFKLDVAGDIRIPNGNVLYGYDATDNRNFSLISLANGGSGGTGVNVGEWEGNYIGGLVLKGGNGNVYVDVSQGNNGTFIVRKVSGSAPTELMRVKANGNVGIGTSTPQYRLSVKGTIGTQELIVTDTSGWPDYVFKAGYQLKPLTEVEQFIRANHHLPDIPSDAEIEKSGVSVGEMQAKLLAKIEELTLHLIQADQRADRMEQKNAELAQSIAQLKVEASGHLK